MGSIGWLAGPKPESSLVVPNANSCRLVLPTNTAPAFRSRAVTGASAAGAMRPPDQRRGGGGHAGLVDEVLERESECRAAGRVGRPAATRRDRAARAAASASSAVTVMKAFSSGCRSVIRARQSSTSRSDFNVPRDSCATRSAMLPEAGSPLVLDVPLRRIAGVREHGELAVCCDRRRVVASRLVGRVPQRRSEAARPSSSGTTGARPRFSASALAISSQLVTPIRALHFVQRVHGAAQVRNGDRSPDHQRHVEGLEELVAGDAFLAAAHDVIGDAVVAAQHQRGHEPEQLLGLHRQRAFLVGPRVEREEALDLEVAALVDAGVHLLAEFTELGQPIAHVGGTFVEIETPSPTGSQSVKNRGSCRQLLVVGGERLGVRGWRFLRRRHARHHRPLHSTLSHDQHAARAQQCPCSRSSIVR